jgi:hypothetical protein
MTKIHDSIRRQALSGALAELRDAMQEIKPTANVSDARTSVLNCVANIISSAPHGSAEQKLLMDCAYALGFRPAYYVNSIRVGWHEGEQA